MRIYIEHPRLQTTSVHYRLESFEYFFAHPYGGKWNVKGRLSGTQPAAQLEVTLAANIDDGSEARAVDELLSLTSTSGEGAAIISWDGEHSPAELSNRRTMTALGAPAHNLSGMSDLR